MSAARVAVGIDPSLVCTGVAVIDLDTGDVLTRRFRTASLGTSLRAKRDRLRKAIAGILAAVPASVAVSVIEVPHSAQQFGAQNERVALYWWLVDQLFARGPVVEVAPAQRAKLATGRGNAPKADVVSAVSTAFPAVHIADDNVADALALAWAGARWARPAAVPPYTPEQVESHSRLAWPIRTQEGA
ncbi:hypothetical protein ACIGCK_04890 [Microbacterium sp. NPDC078428]|uniref:hypothetical protein n=1 Tax=Microbacterium sp. NPDC078428 TaxID=3364190 RepID=UPI0037C71AB4